MSFLDKMFSLEGKTAIVTGAARTSGLCYGMAAALHDAGAKVALFDVLPEVEELAEKLGGADNRYYAVQADLTDAASRETGFTRAVELLGGKLDIMLNGAGMQFRHDALAFPADKFDRVIDINLKSLFYMCQLAGNQMVKQKNGGKIINIASMTSYLGSVQICAYTASKGGVMQLTKALSNEWAGLGINVNAIAPGYMATELTRGMMNSDVGKQHTLRIPAGRWGTPDDLMGAVVFLASPASDYVSGAVIPVDGGYLGR